MKKRVIKKLGKKLVTRVQLLEDQEDLLEQERKNTCELKRFLKLEKDKNEELAQKLAKAKETISNLEGSIGALQNSYDVLQKTHKDIEVQFDALWASTPKSSNTTKTTKVSTRIGCEICYNIDIDALYAKSQQQNVEQIVVESCNEAIGKENDALKLEVKRLEQKVRVLEKQVKAQHSQDNSRNMLNKLEKGKIVPTLAPHQQKKAIHHKKEERVNIDEKIEYAQIVFLNVRRPHIKNDIGYKSGDKHNSRTNLNGKEFIKFTKDNTLQDKK
jgi:transcriptional regulator with XRE-family HTH domain